MNIIENFLNDITEKDGIFFSGNNVKISYPQDGNQNCFQIEENSFWFKHRNNCIIKLVKKYSPNQIFFDIGGGNGFVSKGLEENAITTILMEPGLQGCLNAQKRGLSNILCSSLPDESFYHNSISAVGLFDVLEHIEDDISFLKEINRYMVSGGLIFLSVPAHSILWSKEDANAGHYRRYSLDSITSRLNKCGFKIEYSSYYFSILPVPIFLFRTLPSLFALKNKPRNYLKYKKQHEQKYGIMNKLLNKIWSLELSKIKKEKKIPFGASALVVARKAVE